MSQIIEHNEEPKSATHEDLMFLFGCLLFIAGFVRGIHVNGMLNFHWSVTWLGSFIIQCVGLLASFARPKHPLYRLAERYIGFIPGKELSISLTAIGVFWQQYIYTKLYIIGVSGTWMLDASNSKVPVTEEQFQVMLASSTMFLTTIIMYGTFYLPGILTVNPPNWWLMRNLRNAIRIRMTQLLLEDMEDNIKVAKQLETRALEMLLAGDDAQAQTYFDAADDRRLAAGETFQAIEGRGSGPFLLPPPE